jgi:hypothetical protein
VGSRAGSPSPAKATITRNADDSTAKCVIALIQEMPLDPESELSDTAAFESALPDLFPGQTKGSALSLFVNLGIDVILVVTRLTAELVRPMSFAFANAFDYRLMRGIDLLRIDVAARSRRGAPAIAAWLRSLRAPPIAPRSLAADVEHDAAGIGS